MGIRIEISCKCSDLMGIIWNNIDYIYIGNSTKYSYIIYRVFLYNQIHI